MGRPGSGKGKQSELLMAELEKRDPERKILSLVLFERDNDWSIPYLGKNEIPL